MIKTLIDRSVALVALVILAIPVFIPVWLLICCTSKGGGFYSQIRIGKGCTPFRLYKFRSMAAGSDTQGYATMQGDSRITPIGRFIRKTSIDELPQLFNVLIGDMSLVGPRPDTPMQQSLYTPEDWQTRHTVRPGITGLAQVSGRSMIGYEERLACDLEYARNHTLWMDAMIMLKTLHVLTGKGSN